MKMCTKLFGKGIILIKIGIEWTLKGNSKSSEIKLHS